ncbi:MAG: phosphotransferase [Pseudomonadota bacterium]|nr:phosphotransferase [Pseudomonadota bacterium]
MSDAPFDEIHQFLSDTEWEGAEIAPLAGDASFRRYFRLRKNAQSAMLMHAPPPHEDPAPFLHVAGWLDANGMRAPAVIAEDAPKGWVLTEDFGDHRMREWIDQHPDDERAIYAEAIDTLARLHRLPAGPFAPYDMAVYLREALLLVEWYCQAMGLEVDGEGYRSAWKAALGPLIERQQPGVTVLRDYHAENIMLLEPGAAAGTQGLIDFQDALAGHPAYDLVSLLQDARRDVSQEIEREMLDRYRAAAQPDRHFEADYATLGAQRNAKIVGIFTRLWKRDGKARYLAMVPRVWEAMERDLTHPALQPVAEWFTANIPQEVRDTFGGEIQ